jgi:hypothetical protein
MNKLRIFTFFILLVPAVSFSSVPTVSTVPLSSVQTIKYPFYAGLTVGYGTTTWDGLVGTPDEAFVMSLSTPIGVDEGGTIGGGFIGYEVFPAFALEFSYTHYPNAKLYFDQYSLVTYEYDGIRSLITHTNNYAIVGKFMVPIPHTNHARIFSSVGPSVTHRQDVVYNHWQLTPAFNFGFDVDVTEHAMIEVGANYTAGTAISEMNPTKDYIPFLYSGFARIAWRF